MKNKGNFFRGAALCALMLCFLPLNAQNSGQFDNKYYMSAWGALGYANLLHGNFASPTIIPKTTAAGGVGGLLGVGFEYNYKKFILTFGAEFDYKLSNTVLTSNNHKGGFRMDIGEIVMDPVTGKPIVVGGMWDTEFFPNAPYPSQFVMRYDFNKYVDTYHSMYVNVPLLMGAQFANRFYFLMGGKVGLHIKTIGSVNTAYKTSGIYPEFIHPLENMRDHFFWDYTSRDRQLNGRSNLLNSNIDFGLNVVASLEMGKVIVPRKGKVHYRIAGFADYGVLNIHKNYTYGEAITPPNAPGENPALLQYNPVLASNWAIGKTVNPLLVGVKFTVLLDLGNKEPCVCIEPLKTKWQGRKLTRSRSITTMKQR